MILFSTEEVMLFFLQYVWLLANMFSLFVFLMDYWPLAEVVCIVLRVCSEVMLNAV